MLNPNLLSLREDSLFLEYLTFSVDYSILLLGSSKALRFSPFVGNEEKIRQVSVARPADTPKGVLRVVRAGFPYFSGARPSNLTNNRGISRNAHRSFQLFLSRSQRMYAHPPLAPTVWRSLSNWSFAFFF